ncbi:DUF2071 domain-containing protein [Fimbriiglobus ruber]|uniref:DUF2071 domain-containing protein n=1 Tax=Fimbriiglobus ruber TaxID=1908690 RepID=A0A225E4M8_9BACT|nr:DUF2071 domain-containing protein [Fimbriiglobus ruber]OWK45036.1 hypothetical protein FRUB_01367 [Fimbriiglobus ruber]
MKIPVIRGLIDRRILVNYRVAPDILAALLPAPFRPKLHRGYGWVGICLIRLRHVRPAFLPSWLGIASENAAHRTAVEWDEDGHVREGVYVRRRDTSSRLNALAGGRLFPGIHSHAKFTVDETEKHLEVRVTSDDGATRLSVVGDVATELPATSVFGSLAEASAFFQAGSLGYSATPDPRTFQGLELRCHRWQVEPLHVSSVESNFFDDRGIFPPGSIEFDCALLMRDIQHEWHGRADLCCAGETSPVKLGA